MRYTKKQEKEQQKAHLLKNNCVNTCTIRGIVVSLYQKNKDNNLTAGATL